ncbi:MULTISPECIES: Tc toxin subunit A [Pseudomonas]|uniref:Tc toxin subunit A n=1 Tax=Pseudomonas TaxID=286 RepID=UPI0021C72B10|nr:MULTISPECIES: Tc toxin subunit A [Pseudomonas]MCU1755266.1 Tc toxin subunit A [Pseudomonas helleri]
MPDSFPLLHSLIDPPAPTAEGRLDFKQTMAALNLHSVFDIIRLSRTEFIEQVAQHCDDDAGQAYDNACGYAAQLEFLHREQASLSDDQTRHKRSADSEAQVGPTYAALFKENWSAFCEASSIAALDSPVAYLRALYLFAEQVEKTGKNIDKRNTLAIRRPTLKDMVIDNSSVSRQLPMLTIVNETLTGLLTKHLANNSDVKNSESVNEAQANSDVKNSKSVNEVLAITRYPFNLPFDLAHQQCLLGLSGNKPGVGELNYRLSLSLPLGQLPSNAYGKVFQEAYVAQRLLSELSPGQQLLLTEQFWTESKSAFDTHYGSDEKALKKLAHFMQQTGLTSAQMDELLARGKYLPRPSKNILPAPMASLYGAYFVNGTTKDDSSKRLDLQTNDKGEVELLNTTAEKFDRLQRMIRLQRWLEVSFTQLDTLIISATRCEDSSKETLAINDNTLRVLGVYRYFNRRYGLQAEEFSALLYRLPVHAVGNSDSLFDRVFNRGALNEQSLKLDDSPLNLNATDMATQTTLYQICAALGLSNTDESLGFVAKRTQQISGDLKNDLTTLSAFYRQTRIASLFGLTVMDCAYLAEMLGAANFSEHWIKPDLRSSGSNTPADFLDVLMQMDWAVNWLKSNGSNVQQLRHQLFLNDKPQSSAVTHQLEQLNQLIDNFKKNIFNQEEIDTLSLPTLKSKAKTTPNPTPKLPSASQTWRSLIAQQLVQHSSLKSLKQGIKNVISNHVELNTDTHIAQQQKDITLKTLEPLLVSAYKRIQPVVEHIMELFKDTSHLPDSSDLLKLRLKHVARQFVNALAKPRSDYELKNLLLIIPDAENTLQLPLTREALHMFLLKPHWLDSHNGPHSMLKLTLNTLYLFQQFNHCINTYAVTQDILLSYFAVSNPEPVKSDTAELAQSCNKLLGAILNWDPKEIEGLVNRLPAKRVRSVQELEWLMRGHDIATITGLSSKLLLTAIHLNAHISDPEWQLLGKAVIAAQKP